MSATFDTKIRETVADSRLQLTIYAATGRLIEKRRDTVTPSALPEFQDLRTRANEIKRHTIDSLDHYLEQFEQNVTAHGGRVVFCKDAAEACDFVLNLAKERGARLIVKSKSMTT